VESGNVNETVVFRRLVQVLPPSIEDCQETAEVWKAEIVTVIPLLRKVVDVGNVAVKGGEGSAITEIYRIADDGFDFPVTAAVALYSTVYEPITEVFITSPVVIIGEYKSDTPRSV
jgi:hypothetical protein